MNPGQANSRIIQFLHHLRHDGFIIGIEETIDALDVIQSSGQPDRKTAHHVMRALACRNHDEWQKFDILFNQYWFNTKHELEFVSSRKNAGLRRIAALTGMAGTSEDEQYTQDENSNTVSSGAGRQRTISRADFRFLTDHRAAREIEKLAENLATVLRKKTRRRRIFSRHGRSLDLRRTFRKSMNYGGLPIYRLFNKRQQQPPHLLILHDVSHSMAWNNPLLFRFVRGLIKTFPESEAFVFHTELFYVSQLYRERSLQQMREKLEDKNHMWMGGTCIADSISSFNKTWARSKLHKDTVVIIISDGFDTNDPKNLGLQLNILKQTVKKILWLNPMLERDGFSPDPDFLKQTSQYVDHFAPAHSLESLSQTIRYLSSLN